MIMASLQASTLLSVSSSNSSSFSKKKSLEIHSSIAISRLPKVDVSVPKLKKGPQPLLQDLRFRSDAFRTAIPLIQKDAIETKMRRQRTEEERSSSSVSKETRQLYAILEAVTDRAEMHRNIGEQRNNWNNLMLSSINSITLSAAAMAGATSALGPLLALKLPSMILLSAATTMLVVMNKIQPSQLAEEQRNALRLFGQLGRCIEIALALGDVSVDTIDDALQSMLALDRAYPLPLLGTMIEKFPPKFEPATWWPSPWNKSKKTNKPKALGSKDSNGWDETLESEMREIVKVVQTKDSEDYKRLGNTVLTLHKVLAVSGPVLTGFAALAAASIDSSNGSCWAPIAAAACAALATVTNTLEHGGQVGMVLEMYRNTSGFFSQLEESIESTLAESDAEIRENGELLEMKVAMKLGRSLSQLRDLTRKSKSLGLEGVTAIDEFASKLF